MTMADVDDVYGYLQLPEVQRHMLGRVRDVEHAKASVAQMVGETTLEKDGNCLTLAVTLPGSDTVIGQVELVWLSVEHEQGEIGYIFHPRYQGKGCATEAASAMLRLGFETLRLHRVVGRCSARNDASAGLMRRLRMRQEAHLVDCRKVNGVWREELVFAMLRREWESAQ
jgi:RimJ/RimL family protein N-acetyltransferase